MKLVLLPGVYRKWMTKGGSFSIFRGGEEGEEGDSRPGSVQ
jgi:hypothetical protein